MKKKSDKRLKNLKPIKKGEVRNPYGRPKKEHTFSDTAKELLASNKIEITYVLSGKSKHLKLETTKNFYHGIVTALIIEALKGNIGAVKELIDRTEGRAGISVYNFGQLGVKLSDKDIKELNDFTPVEDITNIITSELNNNNNHDDKK